MDTKILKNFAQEARRDLRKQIDAKLNRILDRNSLEAREHPQAINKLEEEIAKHSREIILEKVAYTWFNRIMALRFMDVNHYTGVGIVSPLEGNTLPEILADALEGHLDNKLIPQADGERVLDLLSGKIKSANAQQEAYRILLAKACNYYSEMMPFLFERIEDYSQLLLPADLLSPNSIITKTREVLTGENCSEVEVIGWLYQFYISEKKDQVMATNTAYKSEDIPAVTQLFTPHWIVKYMVENSLGRLWLENHPKSGLRDEMEYYIEPKSPSSHLKVKSPEEITFIDPCCGSGHILVYAFQILSKIYEEEGYNKSDIAQLILSKNLFGIDIDKRAGDLASFALIMQARSYYPLFLTKKMQQPHVLVMENTDLSESDLTNFIQALENPKTNSKNTQQSSIYSLNLQETISLLQNAETFGSLIQPQLANVDEIIQALEESDISENIIYNITYQKLLKALTQIKFLQNQYHCVVTNPPYMGNKWLNKSLKDFLSKNFKDVKSDLFSAFIIRCREMSLKGGKLGFMTPFVWMFISSYEKLRKTLINKTNITSLIQLEYSGFDGATVPICTFTLENSFDKHFIGSYIKLSDFKGAKNQAPKTLQAIQNPDCGWFYTANQEDFKKIPGSPIAYWVSDKVRDIFANNPKLGDVGEAKVGLQTGDNNKFLRIWSEVGHDRIGFGMASRDQAQASGLKWFPYNKGGEFRKWYGNQEYIVNWENDGEEIRNFTDNRGKVRSRPQNTEFYFKKSVSWSDVTSSSTAFRVYPKGNIFDTTGPSAFFDGLISKKTSLAYLNNVFVNKVIKILNPTMHFQVGYFQDLPYTNYFISINSKFLNKIIDSNLSISHQEWDSRETSWDFKQNEMIRVKAEKFQTDKVSLREAYNSWVKEARETFLELHANEEELNRIFLDIYDLHDEMDKFVDLEDITLYRDEKSIISRDKAGELGIDLSPEDLSPAELRQKKLIIFNKAELMKQFISYSVGVMLGRYSLDKPGLFIANQNQTIAEAMQEHDIQDLTYPIADSNILPIVEGDWFADGIGERFKDFLKITFGKDEFAENLIFIETALGKKIEKYFLKDFYDDHLKRYKKRPIYWLFTSPKGSFNALIYMHRYNKNTISLVLNDYLRDFILKLNNQLKYLKQIALDPDQATSEITKANKEIDKLNKTIKELEDYERDIIYPLATKQIEIDLDDGVKVNYEKLGKALRKI
ncbi:BREX-1 system adenine-specific DNA-methyltransferase PglX [bacterium]|nr:BREX-1 system adenine-specific DNA-methyltransferase PglX [bacterium]